MFALPAPWFYLYWLIGCVTQWQKAIFSRIIQQCPIEVGVEIAIWPLGLPNICINTKNSVTKLAGVIVPECKREKRYYSVMDIEREHLNPGHLFVAFFSYVMPCGKVNRSHGKDIHHP
jgi:hypothetical protein